MRYQIYEAKSVKHDAQQRECIKCSHNKISLSSAQRQKRKKPLLSRLLSTRTYDYCGGFDFQSRRFFCLSETYDAPEHRVKARRQLGGCRRACFTFS